jgi:hypothetical protein
MLNMLYSFVFAIVSQTCTSCRPEHHHVLRCASSSSSTTILGVEDHQNGVRVIALLMLGQKGTFPIKINNT